MSFIKTAYSATITAPIYSLDPVSDLINWIIDSRAKSHFNPHLEDLQIMDTCEIEVTVADGSTVLETHQGK
eukprot:8887934-Ditylum_brightwellii.AAC.1